MLKLLTYLIISIVIISCGQSSEKKSHGDGQQRPVIYQVEFNNKNDLLKIQVINSINHFSLDNGNTWFDCQKYSNDCASHQYIVINYKLDLTKTDNYQTKEFAILVAGDKNNINTYSEIYKLTIEYKIFKSINPLYDYQWYLHNNSQTLTFLGDKQTQAHLDGVTDLNIAQTLSEKVNGEGVVINVVDSGLEINHPDLKSNIIKEWSYDYRYNDNDPSPSGSGGDHGTSVAGIIGMVDNNIGGLGIASGAKLVGHNYLTYQRYLQDYFDALGASHLTNQVDIFNMSFGIDTNRAVASILDQLTLEHFYSSIKNLREKKGAIYIKSAGNAFDMLLLDQSYFYNPISCSKIAGCISSVFEYENNIPYIILVASLNSNGIRSSYSTTGPNIWIAGFGGERATDVGKIDEIVSTTSHANSNYDVVLSLKEHKRLIEQDSEDNTYPVGNAAMITTDIAGCDRGYSKKIDFNFKNRLISKTTLFNLLKSFNYELDSSSFNDFLESTEANGYIKTNAHPSNLNCDYTNSFNGTSAAAPTISGVVALMLQVNPNLTWRDVKYILATTARQKDIQLRSHYGGIKPELTVVNKSIEAQSGILSYNDWYGFGLVDADAAVKKAKYYTSYLDNNVMKINYRQTNTIQNLNVGDNIFTINAVDNGYIEGVVLNIDLETENNRNLIEIILESPSGTKQVIFREWQDYPIGKSIENFSILANAFYREKFSGTWKLLISLDNKITNLESIKASNISLDVYYSAK